MSGISLTGVASLLHSQLTYHAPSPRCSFAGQTIIVTGANAGLGRATVKQLVQLGASRVILAVRTISKGQEAQAAIEQETGKQEVMEVWEVDMSSFASVRKFAQRASTLDRLDVVVLNAGLWPSKFEIVEGHESTILVNVISQFLLARLLLPKLQSTAVETKTTPRMTIIDSALHKFATLQARKSSSIFEGLLTPVKDFDGRYYDSKLLVVLYGRKFAESIVSSGKSSVVFTMVNPGWCISGLTPGRPGEKLLARSTVDGASIIVDSVDATKVEGRHGQYLDEMKVKKPSAWVSSKDGEKTAGRVWSELNQILDRV